MIAPNTISPCGDLRLACLHLLQINAPQDKAAQVRRLDAARYTLDPTDAFAEPDARCWCSPRNSRPAPWAHWKAAPG